MSKSSLVTNFGQHRKMVEVIMTMMQLIVGMLPRTEAQLQKIELLTCVFLFGSGLMAQQAYPIYGPYSGAIYQSNQASPSIMGATPTKVISGSTETKIGNVQPNMLPPGEDNREFITYPVTTDGYKISGNIEATVANGFSVGAKIQNAIVEGPIYPIPIYTFDANGNYKYLNTWSNEQSYYFDLPIGRSRFYYIKIVYRHGYNTINTWQTVNRFPSGIFNNLYYLPGQFVNQIFDKAVNSGGLISTDYIMLADNEVPRSYSKGAAHTQFRINNDWWPDYGNSKLETVELYEAVGGSYYQTSLPFEMFFVNYVKDQDHLNVPIPNMGVFDYRQAILPETVSITNVNVTRFTKSETRTKVLPSGWANDPGGYALYLQRNESLYANVWPSFAGSLPTVALDGGRFFINVTMNLSGF